MRSVRLGLLGDGASELRLKEGPDLKSGPEHHLVAKKTSSTQTLRPEPACAGEQETRPVWLEQSERERAGHQA